MAKWDNPDVSAWKPQNSVKPPKSDNMGILVKRQILRMMVQYWGDPNAGDEYFKYLISVYTR